MKAKRFIFFTVALVLAIGFSSCEKSYTLMLTVNPENAGTVTGAGDYSEGESVVLTATANEGYKFVNWTQGSEELSALAEFNYTTTAGSVTITANFVEQKIATLGAQENTEIPGFLSFTQNAVYTLDEAAQNQSDIDIFCFYEEGNDIAFGGPQSNISGIFGDGDNDPVNWDVQNETRFYQLEDVTVADFDALENGDEAIATYYNEDEGRRKAKMLTKDQIWSIKTKIDSENELYILVKILEVTDGATGNVKFEYKTK
jgi:hypothetical protein